MMKIIPGLSILAFSLICLINTANASKMVFLIESDAGKHVGLSSGDFTSYKNLTSGDDWHLYPSISSDGKKIAYVKGSGAKDLKLMLKNTQNLSERVLTKPGFVLQPRFAKNGEMLFFTIANQGANRIAFVKTKQNTTNTIPGLNFIDEEIDSYFPAPFQSGEMIVYQRNPKDSKKEIVLFDMAQNKKTIIGNGMAPGLSFDERYVAYTQKLNDNWDIHIYDRLTKKTIKVTSHLDKDFSPSFDRHNNLIYTSDKLENGVFSIYKQSFLSWSQTLEQEVLLITKPKTSFYAPKVSGLAKYKVEIKPKMIGTSRSSFGAITYKSKIYAAGGHQGAEHTYPPESFTGRMTSFDINTNTWTNLAPRINKAHGFQLAAIKNSLYAFGGFAYEASTSPAWKSLAIVEKYNIKTNSWKELKTLMPRKRSSNIVAQVDGKIYLMGGWDSTPKFKDDVDGTFHDEIDVFDSKTESWSTLKVKLPKKRRAFSAFVKNGKIYLTGGISEGGSHFALLDDFTQFDPATNKFTEFPKLPFATFAPAAGVIANEAYVFGGMFKLGKWEYEYIPHVYRFDFKTRLWSHTGRYLNEYKGFSQVIKLKKCLGVLGGHTYQNNTDRPTDTFERFCTR
jgi:N-acetylneuraminic acid mutarotase